MTECWDQHAQCRPRMEEVRSRVEEVRAKFELPQVTSPDEIDEVENMLSFDDDDGAIFDDDSDYGLDDSFTQEGMDYLKGSKALMTDRYQDLTKATPSRTFYATRSSGSLPQSLAAFGLRSIAFRTESFCYEDADAGRSEKNDDGVENLSRLLGNL